MSQLVMYPKGKELAGVWRKRKHLIHASYPCEVKKKID